MIKKKFEWASVGWTSTQPKQLSDEKPITLDDVVAECMRCSYSIEDNVSSIREKLFWLGENTANDTLEPITIWQKVKFLAETLQRILIRVQDINSTIS